MAFYAQIAFSDIPSRLTPSKLLSFHYCEECMLAGNMAWGYEPAQSRGSDVRILDLATNAGADGLETVASSRIEAGAISFADVQEVMSPADLTAEQQRAMPDFEAESDFDENLWPGMVHVSRSKVGGWPHWAQGADWPSCEHGHRMEFALQIDSNHGTSCSWGGGGYAYLFVCPDSCAQPGARLTIQTT